MTRGDEVLGKLDIATLMSKTTVAETIDATAGGSADLTTAILDRQQADRFIDLVVDTSVLLKQIRVRRIDHPSGEINKLDLGDIVTEDAGLTASTYAPTASVVNYDTAKVRSCFDLTSNFTEDNIEGTGIRDKLLEMFTKRIAIDLEILALEGDADVTATTTAQNRLEQANDGFYDIMMKAPTTPPTAQAGVPDAQQVDADGAAASYKLYYDMKKAIPTRYRVAKPDYRWLVSSRTYDKWIYDLTVLDVTTNGGAYKNDVQAKAREMGGGGSPVGIKMVEVPLLPEDLSYDAATDGTWIAGTPLNNLIFFIQRDITIEWDRVPRSDLWQVTIHTRNDFAIENTAMIVMAYDVGVDGADYTS